MRRKLFFSLVAVSAAYAQVAPFQTGGINLSSTNTQLVAIPAGSAPTLSNLVVDSTAAGGDSIDVAVGDPSVVISLITPGGTEINAGNAASFGFTFSTNTFSGASLDIPDPLTSAGTHTLIQFPAGQPSGTYQIKANASSAAADTGMSVTYYSSSTVQAGSVTDSSNYRLGDLVIASAFVFDGTTPIQGATITAIAATLIPVQASVGNYQLVSQQALSSTMTLYTYTAQLTNSGTAATNVSAQVSSSDPNTQVVDSTVIFGDVAAGGVATSLNNFSIQLPNTSTFNPSVLSWQVNTPSAPISFTLTDSGAYDAATGDGIYTGTFAPSVTGNYLVYITATGNSNSGVPFSRTTTSSIQVSNPLARLGTFADAPSYDANGLISAVNITVGVNVQVAGTYRLSLDLQASNGNTTQASASAQLNTGSQQIVLSFPFSSLLSLGSNGPYTEAHARLLYVAGSDTTLADYVDNAGSTQSYVQNSIGHGALALTGPYSAAGIVTGAGPTYDLLRVTIGIYSSAAGSCDWTGALTDLTGNMITSSSSAGAVAAGYSSVTLDFNGNVLADAADGPYLVKYFGIYCNMNEATASTVFQTQSFTAAQFTYAPSDFSLAVQSSAAAALPGSLFTYRLFGTAAGPFSGSVALTVSGLPSGATATLTPPALFAGTGPSYLRINTTATTPAGTYSLTVTGTSGALTHSIPLSLTISAAPANFQYARTLTLSHTLVPNTDQANFPFLFSGTYGFLATTANGGGVQNANGYDIVFATDSAGANKLNFEREYYNPATGQVIYWIQIPTLSHTSDTVIYLLYGNSSVTDQSNQSGTWTSNYKAVWHLDESAGTTLYDSSANANNATKPLATDPAPMTGEVGGAQQFSTSDSNFAMTGSSPSADITTTGITISAIVNPSLIWPYGGIYRRTVTSSDSHEIAQVALSLNDNDGQVGYWVGGSSVDWSNAYNLNTWNFITITHDFVSGTASYYLNGALVSAQPISAVPFPPPATSS